MKSRPSINFVTPLFLLSLLAAISAVSLVGCDDDTTTPAPTQPGQTTNLYKKYGGQPTVTKIVDDAVVALVADCSQNPYFTTVLDTTGHDSTDRLKSCLDLFFNSALGGGATYPGPSTYRNAPPGGYQCESMTAIHADLGIPSEVFDQFVTDLGAVLKKNGFQDADITTVATELNGLKSQVVTESGKEQTYDYTPTNPPGNGCTIVPSPSPSASASASPSPSPSASASPSPGPSPSPSPSVSPSASPSPSI